MSLKRVLYTFSVLLKNLLRDKMAIFWLLIFPVLLIILFSSIFGGGGESSIKFDVVLVEKDIPENLEFLPEVFYNMENFKVLKTDFETGMKKLKNGDVSCVILIEGSTIKTYYDNTNPTISSMIPYMINSIAKEINLRFSNVKIVSLVKTEFIPVEAEKFTFIDFYLPGIIAMALMQLGIFSFEIIVNLKEKKILKRLLLTPLKKGEFIFAYSSTRIVIGLIQAIIMLSLGYFVYKMNLNMNFPLFILFFFIGVILFSFMGVLIGGVSKSVDSAAGLAQLINFPMMFLSGIFFPSSFYPDFIQPVIKIIPLTHLGDAMRKIIIKNASFGAVKTNLFILLGWTFIVVLLSLRFFRWE